MVKFFGGASVLASRHGSCDGHLLPLGGEGLDEGAIAQYFTARNFKNGKEKVKF